MKHESQEIELPWLLLGRLVGYSCVVTQRTVPEVSRNQLHFSGHTPRHVLLLAALLSSQIHSLFLTDPKKNCSLKSPLPQALLSKESRLSFKKCLCLTLLRYNQPRPTFCLNVSYLGVSCTIQTLQVSNLHPYEQRIMFINS